MNIHYVPVSEKARKLTLSSVILRKISYLLSSPVPSIKLAYGKQSTNI